MMTWVVEGFSWIALAFYFGCLIPQIIENYQLKSTRGLSDFSLYLFYLAHVSLYFYTFLTDLPLAYKTIAPWQSTAMVVIMIQRLYYGGISTDKFYSFIVIASSVLAVACIPVAFFVPELIASITGWICVVAFAVQPLPQVIKIFKERSVHGFSFNFVLLKTVAVASELMFALLRHLPIQTFVMVSLGATFQVVFFLQFWLYGKKSGFKKINF